MKSKHYLKVYNNELRLVNMVISCKDYMATYKDLMEKVKQTEHIDEYDDNEIEKVKLLLHDKKDFEKYIQERYVFNNGLCDIDLIKLKCKKGYHFTK